MLMRVIKVGRDYKDRSVCRENKGELMDCRGCEKEK